MFSVFFNHRAYFVVQHTHDSHVVGGNLLRSSNQCLLWPFHQLAVVAAEYAAISKQAPQIFIDLEGKHYGQVFDKSSSYDFAYIAVLFLSELTLLLDFEFFLWSAEIVLLTGIANQLLVETLVLEEHWE